MPAKAADTITTSDAIATDSTMTAAPAAAPLSSIGAKVAAARMANENRVVLTALNDLRKKGVTDITAPRIFSRLIDNTLRSEDSFEFRSLAAIERVMERVPADQTGGYVRGPAHDDRERLAAERFKEIAVKPNGSLAEIQKMAVNTSVKAIRKDFWVLQSYPKLVALMGKYTALTTGHLVRDERDAGLEKDYVARELEAKRIGLVAQLKFYERLEGPVNQTTTMASNEEGAEAQ